MTRSFASLRMTALMIENWNKAACATGLKRAQAALSAPKRQHHAHRAIGVIAGFGHESELGDHVQHCLIGGQY